MRFIATVALLALAACVPDEKPPNRQLSEVDTCGAASLQLLVGMPYDARDFEDDERPIRVLPPDSAMTMDHRVDRLNVDLDDDGVITRIWCG